MFHLTYIRHELRRRLGRTVLTALGLALGVGLVIGIISVSQGLDDAQDQVLAPLGSVGTDILVTRVAGDTTGAATGTDAAAPAPGGPAATGAQGQPGRGGFFDRRDGGLNQADTNALLAENSNVVTDLSKLGKPGERFTRDFFLSATLVSFPVDAVAEIARLDGVASAGGGLVQLASHQTGTVPQIVASIQTGGETIEQTVRPEPMTDAERIAFRECLAARGVTIEVAPQPAPVPGPEGGAAPSAQPVQPPPGGGGPGQGGRGIPAFDECLPQRFREFRARFTTPLQTLQQVIDPPSTDITSESYTAAGVDPAIRDLGLITTEQLTAGRWLGNDAPNEVLLNVAYANKKSLAVGDTLPINGTDYEVVGLVSPTLTGNTADVYFTLVTLQALATKEGRVTQVLVKADDADSVDAVAAAIAKVLPGAEVVTTQKLADQVTGSLADAKGLANRLGGALAAIVLVSAFIIAALLTLSSIAKRVREIGTLRAIGWSKARVVGQILGETLGIGLLGGVLGIGAGVLVTLAAEAMAPALSATTSDLPGVAGSNLSAFFGQATSTVRTTRIAMTAPLHASTLLVGVGFALVGGLVAGLVGGWRAARLSPAVALRDIG